MYSEQDLVRIARRENNQKRTYLVMNRFQGKYIPVEPQKALAMFKALADILRDKYMGEKLLLIGFAEAATAVGAAVALELGTDYMQTTREVIPDAEYLYFLEEHSHAREQKLVKNDIDRVMGKIDRIVFIEDELTTGKTIRNIVDLLEKQYAGRTRFSVASILNGMDDDALGIYRDKGIELFWLVRTNQSAYARTAESCRGDGRYILCGNGHVPERVKYIRTDEMPDARRLVNPAEYAAFCETLYQDIARSAEIDRAGSVLVLGTEEFMYPALFVAGKLEASGKNVRFHATARTPAAVSADREYPLHARYELKSLYDSGRTTYIYDLEQYDAVVVVTDAGGETAEGTATLLNALALCGNDTVILVTGEGNLHEKHI